VSVEQNLTVDGLGEIKPCHGVSFDQSTSPTERLKQKQRDMSYHLNCLESRVVMRGGIIKKTALGRGVVQNSG